MPATNTITASDMPTLAAGDLTDANKVNSWFSTFRGHYIPVHTDTTTAMDNAYSFGTTDYRWSVGHFERINLKGLTNSVSFGANSNTSFSIYLDTDCSIFFPNSISSDQIGEETTGFDVFNITAGGGLVVGTWYGWTTTAMHGVSITTYGYPVEIVVVPQSITNGAGVFWGQILSNRHTRFRILRDNSISVAGMGHTSSTSIRYWYGHFIDDSCPAGSHTYTIQFAGATTLSYALLDWAAMKLYAKELK